MAKRALLYALALLTVAPLTAQEPLNADINAKIRQEEASHSQIMRTLHMFTDVYGPRVTGSPNHKAAAEWALKQMASWGLTNGHLEPWDFGHPGWVNERFSAHIIAPVKDQLTCEVVAWTPGTNGPVTAQRLSADPAGASDRGPVDGVPERRDDQGQRADRAGRQVGRRAREPESTGEAPRRTRTCARNTIRTTPTAAAAAAVATRAAIHRPGRSARTRSIVASTSSSWPMARACG